MSSISQSWRERARKTASVSGGRCASRSPRTGETLALVTSDFVGEVEGGYGGSPEAGASGCYAYLPHPGLAGLDLVRRRGACPSGWGEARLAVSLVTIVLVIARAVGLFK